MSITAGITLTTTRDASLYVQRVSHGAYDFESFLSAMGIKLGWTYRCQGGGYRWVLRDGRCCPATAPARFHRYDAEAVGRLEAS